MHEYSTRLYFLSSFPTVCTLHHVAPTYNRTGDADTPISETTKEGRGRVTSLLASVVSENNKK
jgi:hypothetical protein